ncbi:hypothetical protein [Nonomuraea sp. NPDC049709]|uniref:hypothetical protein n=1 Tax=Nonomuraea sp. NPDC049709 TaxID=3154736 RepID=UPI0034431AC0
MVSIVSRLKERPTPSDDVEFALLRAERALHVEGDLRAGRQRFEAAYQAAERQGDDLAMARAALGMSGVWVHEHRTAVEATQVRARQRHALTGIDPNSSLAVRLRARLHGEEDYRLGEHATILRTLAEARASGDPVATAEALSLAHHCLMSPEHETLRGELALDLIGQAARTGRRGDLLTGLLWRTVDLFLAADPRAERSLRELGDHLARRGHLAAGFVADAIKVMLTIRAGRLTQAETLAAACAQRGTDAGDHDAPGRHGMQLTAIRWYQGRAAELLEPLAELVHSPGLGFADHAYFPALAVAAACAGDRRLAAGMLARSRGPALADSSRSQSWLAAMHGVAEAAHLLDDTDTAAQAYRLLTPYARLPAMAGLGIACFGSTHHALGMAALTIGDLGTAVEHLGQAVQANLGLGHWPAAVLSRWRLGQTLSMRHGTGYPPARQQLALAEQEATELGMTLPAGTAPRSRTPRATCRRHGRQWQFELNGRTARVDDSVGVRYLAILIANPGREIRATDLAAGRTSRSASRATRAEAPVRGDDTGMPVSVQPVLDQLAERTYKERLLELQAEIAELESLNDTERAVALRAERDWLAAELAAATGLGGRVRPFTDDEERARIAVGKAIRRALTRITEADDAIGEELRATIATGGRCCYHPR